MPRLARAVFARFPCPWCMPPTGSGPNPRSCRRTDQARAQGIRPEPMARRPSNVGDRETCEGVMYRDS